MYTPTALSLFSGCGGDTLGMTNAGSLKEQIGNSIPPKLVEDIVRRLKF